MPLPSLTAFEHVPPSKFGHVAGQPISAGVMPLWSHAPRIVVSSFALAGPSFPCRSQATIVPPGACWPLPTFTPPSLHFCVTFVITFTYFVSPLLIVRRHLKSVSAAVCAVVASTIRMTRDAAPMTAPLATALMTLLQWTGGWLEERATQVASASEARVRAVRGRVEG